MERDFKGVWIPKSIWLDTNLSVLEKCLLVEIDSLDNDFKKGCFASNDYLGKFIGVTEGRCANIISDLKKRGYLIQCFFDGRNRGLRLHENVKADCKSESRLHENVKADFTETLNQTSRKREHNNTISNTVNNTDIDNVFENLILPYESKNFKTIWLEWKKIKTYKTKGAEQIELHQLSQMCDNEKDCIDIICNSIKNGWKQFYPLKKEDLSKFKSNGKSEQQHTINEQTSAEFLSAEYERRFNKS